MAFLEGTLVMMADGTPRKAEDIRVGDELMGEDRAPRKVSALRRGADMMIRVVPDEGRGFSVQADGIITFRDRRLRIIDMSIRKYQHMDREGKAQCRLIRLGKIRGMDSLSAIPFTLDKPQRGRYFGFDLSGNGRFLLADGTVVHA